LSNLNLQSLEFRVSSCVRTPRGRDRKSTRLNSSHDQISYAVFCLKKKKHIPTAFVILSRSPSEKSCAYTFTARCICPSPSPRNPCFARLRIIADYRTCFTPPL